MSAAPQRLCSVMTGLLVVYFAAPMFQYSLAGAYVAEIERTGFDGPVARLVVLSSAMQQVAALGLAVLAMGLAASAYGRLAFRVGLGGAVLIVVLPDLLAFGILSGGMEGAMVAPLLSLAEMFLWVVPVTMGFALALACLRFYPRPLAWGLFAALVILSFGIPLLRHEALPVFWGLMIALVTVLALRPSRRGDVPAAARPWMLAAAASFALSFFIYVVPDLVLALGQHSVALRLERALLAFTSAHFSYELTSAKALVVAALLSLNAGWPLRRIALVFAVLAIGSEAVVFATELWLRAHLDPDFAIRLLSALGIAVQFLALMLAILLHWTRPERAGQGQPGYL